MPENRRPHAMTQNDIYGAKYVCDGALSADGALAAYVLSETAGSGDKEKQVTSIWLVGTDGGQPRRLTRGDANDTNPVFSRDGKSIFFLSSRDNARQIYRIPVDGGEAEALTSLPQGAGAFQLSPDGKHLAFAASAAADTKPDTHVRVDRAWYRFDPLPGYLENVNQAVYVMRTAGGDPRPVTDHDAIITSGSFSPDGKQIAFIRMARKGQEFIQSDLCLANLSARGARPATLLKDAIINGVTWGADGNELYYPAPAKGLASQYDLWSIDASGGAPRNRTRHLDGTVGAALQIHNPAPLASRIIANGERRAYAVVTAGGQVHIHDIAMKGRTSARRLTDGERVCHLFAAAAGKLLFASQSTNSPPELHLLDETGEERQLSDHNAAWAATVRWPRREHLIVKSKGTQIEGWVLVPKQSRPPYRTVLYIHGGPHSGFGESFNFDFHELVGAGYAVAFANPRGSTGYGQDFCRAIIGRWGDLELQDFNAFLDELVRRGIAHPDRLGVTGISGGGHLSAWLIGHSHRFKAAVPEQGVYNMLSFWGTSDAGKALAEVEMGGPPHKIPMTYWERSPLAFAHRCQTPTLLIQGENDIRCPMEQAEQLYASLQHHGCTTELIRLQKCNHGAQLGGPPALRRYRMSALLGWFDKYLK